jgi:hypothetical protein
MKYWNNEGKQQELYDSYCSELVPIQGEAETPEGEALRSISQIYYDVYNNGACNIFRTWPECDGDECWDEKEIERNYASKFEAIRVFTGEDMDDLIAMCERCAEGYWPERIGDVMDNIVDTIIDKIKLSPPPPRECETKSPSNKYVWIGDQYVPVESLI